MQKDSRELAVKIAQILDEKKAAEIAVIDIHELTVVTDFFVIVSGNSEVQVKALYDELEDRLKAEGIEPRHRDGYQNGRWIVLDYDDVIVHIFHRDERTFYSLERLWADGQRIQYQ